MQKTPLIAVILAVGLSCQARAASPSGCLNNVVLTEDCVFNRPEVNLSLPDGFQLVTNGYKLDVRVRELEIHGSATISSFRFEPPVRGPKPSKAASGQPGVKGTAGAPGRAAGLINIVVVHSAKGRLSILNRGGDGSPGGPGGDGGDGYKGQPGEQAQSGIAWCTHGGGDGLAGGNGGDAGEGGVGGPGGVGGAVRIELLGRHSSFQMFYNVDAGRPGSGGAAGLAGSGGSGGEGGSGSGWCKAGSPGAYGQAGKAASPGAEGAMASAGSVAALPNDFVPHRISAPH